MFGKTYLSMGIFVITVFPKIIAFLGVLKKNKKRKKILSWIVSCHVK